MGDGYHAIFAVVIGGILSISISVDAKDSASLRRETMEKLGRQSASFPVWISRIRAIFIDSFDYVYSPRNKVVAQNLWLAILLSYLILAFAWIILRLCGTIIPNPSEFLAAAIGITVAEYFAIHSFSLLLKVFGDSRHRLSGVSLLRDRQVVHAVLAGSLAIVLGVLVGLRIIDKLGIDHNTTIALAVSGGLVIITGIIATALCRYVLTVHPVRAIISSLMVIFILSRVFRMPVDHFEVELGAGNIWILAFIAYNLFADSLSLVETRWVLRACEGRRVLGVAGLLAIDLILSAAIFLVLPLLAGQDLGVMLESIFFRGPMPWLGILFWSTFSTSALFYLYVISIIVYDLLYSPAKYIVPRFASERFMYSHPNTLTGITIVLPLLLIWLGLCLFLE